MIGVGLFLTILIVSIVLLVTNLGVTTATNASGQVANINKSVQKQLITQYDQIIVTGQDVVNAINLYNDKLNNNIIVYNNRMFLETTTDAFKVHSSSDTSTISMVYVQMPKSVTSTKNIEWLASSYNKSSGLYDLFYSAAVFKYDDTNSMSVSTNTQLISKVDMRSNYKAVLIKEISGEDAKEILGIAFLLI